MISPTLDPAMLGAAIHARKERDFYPTIDENVTHALARFMLDTGILSRLSEVWECAVGDGAMATVLENYFPNTVGSDIEPLTPFGEKLDFLQDDPYTSDAIITNPPYGAMTTAFIERGLQHIRNDYTRVVAILARNELDCAATRKHLFSDCPEFYAKLVLTWRPRWIAGSTGAPRHNYAWFIWIAHGPIIGPRILYASKAKHFRHADCANELPI
jgi:hypothetical protein